MRHDGDQVSLSAFKQQNSQGTGGKLVGRAIAGNFLWPAFPNLQVARAVVTRTSKGRILRHYGMPASTTNVRSVLVWRHQPRGTTPRTAQKSQSHLFGTPILAKGLGPMPTCCSISARHPLSRQQQRTESWKRVALWPGQCRCSRTTMEGQFVGHFSKKHTQVVRGFE